MGHHRKQHGLRWALCVLVAGLIAAPLAGAGPARAARVHGAPARILHAGSRGPLVKRLQRLLGVPADGVFGRHTRRAVRRFQRRHGLVADGQVGPLTWRALERGTQRRARNGRPHARRALTLGDHGRNVSRVQRILGLPVNGRFDRGTWRAVRAFQRRAGLVVDGQVGPRTWAALRLSERRRLKAGILRLGDRSGAVGKMQHLLGIRVNDLFDRRTWRAVRRFQRRHGLTVDGVVGPQTRRALAHTGSPATGKAPHRHGSGALGRRAVGLARQEIGVRYRWGGATPRGFDCSGLVQYVYGRLGVQLPRVTYAQWHAGRHIARRDLRPGDLVFFDHRGHVGIYSGHGWFVHAPHTGQHVHASQMSHGWFDRHYDGAVRVG